jgi:hypothetical protein
MAAPVSIASTHVHSMRTLGGSEALVARVVTVGDGVTGYGFSLGPEATPARDMAAWDALARSCNVPLHALFGKKTRGQVPVARDEAGHGAKIDPFELLSVENVLAKARTHDSLVLVAAHSHPWELSYCAALAGAMSGNVVIAARHAQITSLSVSDAPGIAVDWSLEPGFAALRWDPAP